ncbi:hypothetical protein WN943_008955 [Citrus x changshan-huyou]
MMRAEFSSSTFLSPHANHHYRSRQQPLTALSTPSQPFLFHSTISSRKSPSLFTTAIAHGDAPSSFTKKHSSRQSTLPHPLVSPHKKLPSSVMESSPVSPSLGNINWLQLAVEDGVRELDFENITDENRVYMLPQAIFSANSVTNLRLVWCRLE